MYSSFSFILMIEIYYIKWLTLTGPFVPSPGHLLLWRFGILPRAVPLHRLLLATLQCLVMFRMPRSPQKKHEKKQDGQIVLQLKPWKASKVNGWRLFGAYFWPSPISKSSCSSSTCQRAQKNVPQVYPSIALAAVSGVKLLLATTPLPPSMLF